MAVKSKHKLGASSIIEVVIAMTIIAVVVAIGSMVYVNVNQSNSSLQEINEEGEILTDFINKRLILKKNYDERDLSGTQLIISESESETNYSTIYHLKGRNENTLWKFEVLNNDNEE